MDWLHPTYVWAGLIAVAGATYVLWQAWRRRQDAYEQFGERTLVRRLATAARPRRHLIRSGLVLVALVALTVALMGPRIGTEVRTVEREGVDLVVALDVSASMRAQDVAPSRLERAKEELNRLTQNLDGSRVGLVLFAGQGLLQAPLTADYDALQLFLDVSEPDQVAVQGTNIEALLSPSLDAFETARPPSDTARPPDEQRARALLVVSDGEIHEGTVETVKRRAERNGITLFAAGVGTAEGAQVPLYEDGRQVAVKRTADGHPVRSRLQESTLRELSEDGAYFRVGATTSALDDLTTALQRLETTPIEEERFETYVEMYQWPLALALLLLVLERGIPTRARPSKKRTPVPL